MLPKILGHNIDNSLAYILTQSSLQCLFLRGLGELSTTAAHAKSRDLAIHKSVMHRLVALRCRPVGGRLGNGRFAGSLK